MVFIAGWIMQVVIIFGYPYTPDYYGDVVVGTVLFTLLPWYVLLTFVTSFYLHAPPVCPPVISVLAMRTLAFTLTSWPFALQLIFHPTSLPFACCTQQCVLPFKCPSAVQLSLVTWPLSFYVCCALP